MDILQVLKQELTEEFSITKKFFSRFPKDRNGYAPHEKSMKLMPLCSHISDIFGWAAIILETPGLDFAETPKLEKIEGREQLSAKLEKNFKVSAAAIEKAGEADLQPNWYISMNGHKLKEWTK